MQVSYIYLVINVFAFLTINTAYRFASYSFLNKKVDYSIGLSLRSNRGVGFMGDSGILHEVNPIRKDLDERTASTFQHLPIVDHSGNKMDIYSRLLQDRIILVGRFIDDITANMVVAQLLHLENEHSSNDIQLYINCPGGSISSTMAIFDTMQYIQCPIQTVCFGTASAMGAFLLGAGTKGKRKALPNARIMMHQPLGGARGQAGL